MDAHNSVDSYPSDMVTQSTSILVIEKHPLMRESLFIAINEEPDMQVLETRLNGSAPIQLALPNGYDLLFLEKQPDIVLIALGNPGDDDLRALEILKKRFPKAPILAFITEEVPGQDEIALAYGAQKVLTKTLARDKLIVALRSAKTESAVL